MHLAAQNALATHDEVANQFSAIFGRHYRLVEGYQLDDADYVLVMSNAFATKGKSAINRFRAQGSRVGLLRLRVLCPFPGYAIAAALDGRKAVAVIDQNLLVGFRGSWLYTTMGSAPAGAQGVRDALDILLAKGKLLPDDDLRVVVVAGDGSTYDMPLSATSGTLYRNLDYWYICYDNEAYGNTGMQQSSATPYAARTATSSTGTEVSNTLPSVKKDIFEIWRAHHPPYIATVSSGISSTWHASLKRLSNSRGPSCSWHLPHVRRGGCMIPRTLSNMRS